MVAATPRNVDEYISTAPEAAQPMLRELRELICTAAPEAEERISYGMPHYEQHGRVTYFAAHTRHIAMYAVGEFAEQLKPYMTMKSTARFPIGQPLPADLIRDVVRARVRDNEARHRAAAEK